MYCITSDSHFGHDNILNFERDGIFKTIEEHDEAILNIWTKAMKNMKAEDTFYFLGDFGWVEEEYFQVVADAVKDFPCKKVMVIGNHDSQKVKPHMYKIFNEVHDYPIWISNRICLSHFPVAVYEDTVNVHGHLHGSHLRDPQHICASVHVAGYKCITDKMVSGVLGTLPKPDRRFLYEPYIADTIIDHPHNDIVYDSNGRIDVSASRLYMKLKKEHVI